MQKHGKNDDEQSAKLINEDPKDRSEIDSYVITLGNLNKQAFIDLILSINHET